MSPARISLPFRWNALWKHGAKPHEGPVHVSMNDYLIRRWTDIPRVARDGLALRAAWPETEGALGLWFLALRGGRRQVSISVWRSPEDLKHFVRTPAHLEVMRRHRNTGDLYTNAWKADRLDRALIWRQALDRLHGRVEGVPHH